jgi:hypothetical protein
MDQEQAEQRDTDGLDAGAGVETEAGGEGGSWATGCIDPAIVREAMQAVLPELLLEIKAHDTDYTERYELVLTALSVANQAGYPAGIRIDPSEPEWPLAVIELPDVGQVSWHLPAHPWAWDGHTTEEKYRRIDAYAAANTPLPLAEVRRDLEREGQGDPGGQDS